MTKFFYFFILAVIAVIIGSFILRNSRFQVVQKSNSESTPSGQSVTWKTYSNAKYGYSINYPSDWQVREYPNTQTGAGFQPNSLPADPGNKYITIDVLPKVGGSTDFASYVKTAAVNEIQGYKTLQSISPVQTTSQNTGYTTTWQIIGPGPNSNPTISGPITYFDLLDTTPPSTLQIVLSNPAYQNIYNQMLQSVILPQKN